MTGTASAFSGQGQFPGLHLFQIGQFGFSMLPGSSGTTLYYGKTSASSAYQAGDAHLTLTGTNTYFQKPIDAATNIAPFTTVDNPTNSYQNPNPVFVFTNGNYRTLITGSAVLQAINGVAKLDIQYTNNGVGYVLPLELISTGLSMTMPFSFPLSPGGTFQYNTVLGANSSVGVTNVVGWIQ